MMYGDWQPAALYGGMALIIAFAFWKWHRNPLANFNLKHAFANRDGFYDPDRANLTGTFLISSFAIVICVIRNAVDPQLVLLLGVYTSAFALKSAWNYTVARRGDVDVKREEIRRGRVDDVSPDADIDDPNAITVAEEQSKRSTPRRRKTDSVFK